jgi:A/G-specific adenine glycosylase
LHVAAVHTSNTRPSLDSMQAFQRAVLRFYRRHKRDLPWRRTNDPYRILVSEVMLQQTQVDRVIPKYRSFLARFPTLRALARARFADVLREWLGLGYNGRALRLWQCARAVVRETGKLPANVGELERLPGIGPYTAAAVAAIAFGVHVPAVDVNVRRVLTRALSGRDHLAPPRVSLLASAALPKSSAAQWSQALMDIGSMYCKASPRCDECPLRVSCAYVRGRRNHLNHAAGVNNNRARRASAFIGSSRFYRGRVMRVLASHKRLQVGRLGREVKKGFSVTDGAWLQGILAGLERDGLIRFDRSRKTIRLP